MPSLLHFFESFLSQRLLGIECQSLLQLNLRFFQVFAFAQQHIAQHQPRPDSQRRLGNSDPQALACRGVVALRLQVCWRQATASELFGDEFEADRHRSQQCVQAASIQLRASDKTLSLR